jgi:hypothetical protein
MRFEQVEGAQLAAPEREVLGQLERRFLTGLNLSIVVKGLVFLTVLPIRRSKAVLWSALRLVDHQA